MLEQRLRDRKDGENLCPLWFFGLLSAPVVLQCGQGPNLRPLRKCRHRLLSAADSVITVRRCFCHPLGLCLPSRDPSPLPCNHTDLDRGSVSGASLCLVEQFVILQWHALNNYLELYITGGHAHLRDRVWR